MLPALAGQETLYSWCAAVHRRSVSGSVTETSRRLFGSHTAALLHDFPARLGELTQRTEGQIGGPRELAIKHTLLGYFLPFCDAGVAETHLARVSAGSVPDIKMRLGIPASGIGGYHPLRCCKECIEADLRDIGRPTWRICHQAPSA